MPIHSSAQQTPLAGLEQYLSDPKIRKVPPGSEAAVTVLSLIRKYTAARQDIIDVAIVATMIANGIGKIWTYGTARFSRFSEIEVLRPSA